MFNNAEILAIQKAAEKVAKEEKTRDKINPGTYQVSVNVKVTGTLTVAPDTERVPTVSIPLLPALALALKYAGVTGQAARNAILRGVREALEAGKAAADILPEGLEAEVAALKKSIAAELPKTPVKGAVKFAGTLELVK